MSDKINNKIYLDNRLKYHTASRVAIQEGETLQQALNNDTHAITSQKIWTSPITGFPVNSGLFKETTDGINASINLVSVFKQGELGVDLLSSSWYSNDTNGTSGIVWTNSLYPNVKLFENVIMTPVNGSR